MKLLTVVFLLVQLVFFSYAKNGVYNLFSFWNPNDKFIHFASFCFDNWGHEGYGHLRWTGVKWSNPSIPADAQGLEVAVFSDEDHSWPKFMAERHTMTCEQQLAASKKHFPLVGPDYIAIHQEARPRFWHAVIFGCGVNKTVNDFDIRLEYSMTNPGGFFAHQFSKEEQGMLEANMIFIPLFLIVGVLYVFVIYKFVRSKSFHFIVILYSLCYIFYLVGVCLTFLHLIVYAADGWGIKFFGVLGSMFKTASEIVLIVVLLLMAAGWTISFQSLPRIHRYIIPVVVAFYCFVSIILYIWSEFGIPIGSIQYIYQTWPGLILTIFRIPLLAYFIILLIFSCRKERQEEDSKKIIFYTIFGPTYGIWFMILPLIVALAYVLEPWWRIKVIEIVSLIFDFGALTGLVVLLWPSRALKYFRFDQDNTEDSNAVYYTEKIYSL